MLLVGLEKEYSDGIGTDPVFVDPDLSVSVYEGTSVVRGVGAFIDCPPPTVEFVMKFIGTDAMETSSEGIGLVKLSFS